MKEKPIHPGAYIKAKLPIGLSVKEAAKLLGVGRPALSNLLNQNADLSQEMAARIDKAFGISKETLLQLQSESDQWATEQREKDFAVCAYVPPFLKITARDIEGWADHNVSARVLLPVLLRKLTHSTGRELSLTDFPGYDNAERRGWDGRIEAGGATPWIPNGNSGWEFGCDEKPGRKAEQDYATRTRGTTHQERQQLTFVFVTPRNWPGKNEWVRLKEATAEWKSVRAYDSSDLEQWLEQSIPAQTWIAEQMGRPTTEGLCSLDEQWRRWASVTDPELPKALFQPSVASHKGTLKTWLDGERTEPLIVSADSKDEALALLSCLFNAEEFVSKGYSDRAIVFSSATALRKLLSSPSPFIAIVASDEVEREVGGAYRTTPTIVIRPRNSVEMKPDIVLDLLRYETFKEALATIGIDDHRIDTLARESGYSPTILRRRLARLPALRTPPWAEDGNRTRTLVPMMLVGTWHAQSNADREILALLAGSSYPEIENQIAHLLTFDDPPIWSVGHYRGVSSKIDTFFAVQRAVTQKDLDDYFFAAELVLSETDPALDLPEDQQAFAGLYGKTREHSGALRDGICETLVILTVHGNNLFRERLGIDVGHRVDALVRRLLTPLTPEKLLSQNGSLPVYAEAAPNEFLSILEEDLRSPQPQVYALLTPADGGVFGRCPRTGLLWALETAAWKPEQLSRVCAILAQLVEKKINDNWVNKPDNSLLSIFRSWMPQTAASLDQRKEALEVLTRQHREQAWKICCAQFASGMQTGQYNARPRWRNDASGAGQPVGDPERYEFFRKALDLALAWRNHTEETLSDLVGNLHGIPEEDQNTVWNLIDAWANAESDNSRKAILRERIRRFAFTRPAKGIKTELTDRARKAYELLTPSDTVVRHRWLFSTNWIEESCDELEEERLDWSKRDERIRKSRNAALQEIWSEQGFDGIQALLANSDAARTIGWHLADGVIGESETVRFMADCLEIRGNPMEAKNDELISGITHRLNPEVRTEITRSLLIMLSPEPIVRLLKCSPFDHDTWGRVSFLEPEIRAAYWSQVHPGWTGKSADINEAVDSLLAARRPRAAFQCAHIAMGELETSRLKRLLYEVGTCESEQKGTYPLHAYDISAAFEVLQGRADVTEEEMAGLEFLFIRALDDTSEHGIPNLERQLAKSPSLFMQLLAWTYKRTDGGQDPPEWRIGDSESQGARCSAAYALLERVQHTPGVDQAGQINSEDLKCWINELRALCAAHGRLTVGDHHIGKLLSAVPIGGDGVWPCEEVRRVLEEVGSPDIAKGMAIGVFNSRGVHFRGEGGDQERELAAKYRNWARKLSEYPYVSRSVEQIASQYEREAAYEDTEAAVRRRLWH